MKKLFLFLSFLVSIYCSAQQVSTTISGYNAYVYTPPSSSSVQKFPVLICVPGNGEVGSNISLLNTYLPCKFIASGALVPGMMVICVQPSGQWPSLSWLKQMYDSIMVRYPVNPSQVYGTGYSAGGTVWDQFCTTYPKLVSAVFSLSAPPMNNVTADAPLYKSYALAGGHFWGLSGSVDLTTGYVQFADTMNVYAPGSAISTIITGMGHGGWDTYYNPSYTLNGKNCYQWMLQYGQPVKQNIPPVANAGAPQTITLPTNSATLNSSGSYDPDGTIASTAWTVLSGPSTTMLCGSTLFGLVAGVYTVQLMVVDNQGATGTSQTTITVLQVPKTVVCAMSLSDGKTFTLYSDGSYTLK